MMWYLKILILLNIILIAKSANITIISTNEAVKSDIKPVHEEKVDKPLNITSIDSGSSETVRRIHARKGVNETTSTTTTETSIKKPTDSQQNVTSTSTTSKNKLETIPSTTKSANSSIVTSNSTSTTSPTTTTTTTTSNTTTTTTTTTTPKPKKPTVTLPLDENPALLKKLEQGRKPVNGKLMAEEPIAQLSMENIEKNNQRQYIVPIVTLIFVIPLILGLFILSYRRAKDFWLTRHYRRMDFLIDGMYNY